MPASGSAQFATLNQRGPAHQGPPVPHPMITAAAIRMQQFGVQFYQASLTASDIDKLVRFEVLSYGESAQPPVRGGKPRLGLTPSKVNWDLLERRIASSEKADQRRIIPRQVGELVAH